MYEFINIVHFRQNQGNFLVFGQERQKIYLLINLFIYLFIYLFSYLVIYFQKAENNR